jgi:hypothetical protein
MYLHEFFYNNRRLYVEFSTEEDGDDFYRILELDYSDIVYYSIDIIDETDLRDLDEDLVIEIIKQYMEENELPEQLSL